MKHYISPGMRGFLTPKPGLEEALDQPLYHIRTYPTTGQLSLTFFNQSVGDAGLASTNMDSNSELSKGKREGVFELGVAFMGGADAVEQGAADALDALLNDAKNVLEGQAVLEFKILEKIYLTESPLIRVPAGIGLCAEAGGIQDSDVAATTNNLVSYGSNGMPIVSNKRKLRVPIAIPAQTKFNVTITWPALVTVSTASRLGVWLDGMQIRAIQ